jgi:hypothetical protein
LQQDGEVELDSEYKLNGVGTVYVGSMSQRAIHLYPSEEEGGDTDDSGGREYILPPRMVPSIMCSPIPKKTIPEDLAQSDLIP